MAGFIWWSMVAAIFVNCVWAIVGDIWLWRRGLPMLTDYLRGHPWAFWSSAIVLGVGTITLAVHLFIQAHNGGQHNPPVP